MTPEEFASDNPLKNDHSVYEQCFLRMEPAPEMANGEVVLASLYRNIGFSKNVTEGKVPKLGRDFYKRLERGRQSNEGTGIGVDTWKAIVMGSLRSPRTPQQTATRFLQVCPLVPDAAAYSLSARLSGSPWNPGQLVARMICQGEPDETRAREMWNTLFHQLSVDDEDDVWARFLEQEFSSWRPEELIEEWRKPNELPQDVSSLSWTSGTAKIPANQFVRDLGQVMLLKQLLTRRQWISIVESILRLGTASHVLWICHANDVCWSIVRDVLRGGSPPEAEEILRRLTRDALFWQYGQLAVGTIKEFARNYVVARTGLNLLLWHCDELDVTATATRPDLPLSNVDSIGRFATFLARIREEFPVDKFWDNFRKAVEIDPRMVACKRGSVSANVVDFLRHVLGQRQTTEQGMDSYDQGFYLRKRGPYRSAPWIFSLGPVSVLTLVHCCTQAMKGPRTVEDFCGHLSGYGITVEAQDVPGSDLGRTLRNLGLVLDSPDAEGGMVILSPFRSVVDGDER
jgi:hypothetical protein